MAKVPVYDAPQVKATGYSGNQQISTPGDAFGIGLGKATQDLSNAMSRVAGRMIKEDGETEAKDRLNKYREDLNDLGYGEGGFYTTEGKDAMDGHKGYMEQVEKLRKKHGEGLTNQHAIRMFDEESKAYGMREDTDSSKKVATERYAYQNKVLGERLLMAQNDGAIRPNDNGVYAQDIERITRDLADRQGLDAAEDKDVIDRLVKDNVSAMHATAIDHFIARDDGVGAEAYLERAIEAGTITDVVASQKRELINGAMNEKIAMDFADRFVGSSLDRGERLAEARRAFQNGNLTAAQRTLTENRIKGDWQNQEDNKTNNEKEAMAFLAEKMMKAPNATWSDLREEYPEAWNIIKDDKENLAFLMRGMDGNRRTDRDKRLYVRGMIASGNHREANEYLQKHKWSFSVQDFSTLSDQIMIPPQVMAPPGKLYEDSLTRIIGAEPDAKKKKSEWDQWHAKSLLMRGWYDDERDAFFDSHPEYRDLNKIPEDEEIKILNRMINEETAGGFDIGNVLISPVYRLFSDNDEWAPTIVIFDTEYTLEDFTAEEIEIAMSSAKARGDSTDPAWILSDLVEAKHR